MIHYYLTFFTRLRLPISISQHSGWLTVLEPFGSSSSLFNCAGVLKRSCGPFLPEPWIQKARKKSNSSSYWFLSLGAVVDWNYSYLRYSYFLINCAGAKLRNQTLRVTDFCFAPYIAQSPLRKTGTRVPSSRMPSISIWLEPIMKSTWTSERLSPAASSSSSVNSAPPSTLVA